MAQERAASQGLDTFEAFVADVNDIVPDDTYAAYADIARRHNLNEAKGEY
jgi:hypothetical protein